MVKTHKLSDGTTITVRVVRTIAGTWFIEQPSRKRNGAVLYRIDTHMFLVLEKAFIPIRHPDYSYAADDKSGAEVALRFFVDGAEGCIREAAKEGVPVERMYGL